MFEFSLPYYFFLMCTVTLVVSSMSFYKNLRDLLYPEIAAYDEERKNWTQLFAIKTRFFTVQFLILFFLMVFCCFIVG